MTLDEYRNKLKALKLKQEGEQYALMDSYANYNNPYVIGDIIEDNSHIIEIQQIRTYYDKYTPSCVYLGVELKKDLTPKVRPDDNTMYQNYVKRKLKRKIK